MTAINRNMVRIAIMEAGTNPSAVQETDYIRGEIKSYNKTGGDKEVESDPHFGGDVRKDQPRNEIEISFEITPSLDNASRWENLSYGTEVVGGQTIYVTSADATDKAVFIENITGTTAMSWAFDEALVTTLDIDHNADDVQTKSLNLKLAPQNQNGRTNFMAVETTIEAMPAWTSLANGV
jgi:hypothetical protein